VRTGQGELENRRIQSLCHPPERILQCHFPYGFKPDGMKMVAFIHDCGKDTQT